MCPGEVLSAVTSPGLLLAAERAVRHASELMREGRSHVGAVIPKGDRDFATVVDVAVEEVIKAELGRSTPEIPFLGEEEGGVGADAEAVWVLDPIDGTANFAKESPLCGVSLALLERGTPTLGLIELPFLGERYVAAREPTDYWLSNLPADAESERLARLARLRWKIELDYQQLKGELGLDHYEGRSWLGWYHHTALVSAAHGFLTLERMRDFRRRPA